VNERGIQCYENIDGEGIKLVACVIRNIPEWCWLYYMCMHVVASQY